MRLILLLLLFTTLATNEVLLDLFAMTELEVKLVENPIENQSEKEQQDSAEEESKIEQILDNQRLYSHSIALGKGNLDFYPISFANPHLEIFSPPPEL